MKKACLLALLLGCTLTIPGLAQGTGLPQVTLYSPQKYEQSFARALFNFEIGSLVPERGRWDLNYGSLYAGEEHDWFQVSTSKGCRTAFRDLGALSWTDSFRVPTVEPFPELKAGEQRHITVDVSGADGKPGAPGRPGVNGEGAGDGFGGKITGRSNTYGMDTPAPVEQPWLAQAKAAPPSPPAAPRARQDGVPKIDPIFVKAVIGHIYVIHVVDSGADYYALFRVESLERGDHVTISWKLIPPPEMRTGVQEK